MDEVSVYDSSRAYHSNPFKSGSQPELFIDILQKKLPGHFENVFHALFISIDFDTIKTV